MSFMPDLFTPNTLSGMADNLTQSLANQGISGAPDSKALLAGVLGFESWNDAIFDAEANHWIFGWADDVHPGMQWLAERSNRMLFWKLLSMQMLQGLVVYDSVKRMETALPQAGAPPEIEDVLEMLRYRIIRDDSVGGSLASLMSKFSAEEAMAVELHGRLGSFAEAMRSWGQGHPFV